MIKSVSQKLGYAAPISLTINGSVLPVPGYGNHIFITKDLFLLQPCYYALVSEGSYDDLVMLMVCICDLCLFTC